MPLSDLIDYILENFHQVHRAELPELLRLANKVERVHADKPDCPHGLSEHLLHMAQELEMHMQKEEQILFPMIKQGSGSMVLGLLVLCATNTMITLPHCASWNGSPII